MGQRLVIKIHAFGEDVAAIYYHWSAYTVSTLCEARDILNHEEILNSKSKDEFLYHLIRAMEDNGGGIDGGEGSSEWQFITSKLRRTDFKPEPDRNCGLVAISEDGMCDLENYAEEELLMDFDEQVIQGGSFCEYSSIDEINQYLEECDCDKICEEDIHYSEIDPSYMSFAEIEDAIGEFSRYNRVKHDGYYYDFIE